MRWVLIFLALPFAAAATDYDREVDVELFLAVDVSRSMSPAELEIQRRGYAEALRSPEVVEAIQSGLLGRIAITYVEWAGQGSQRVVVDWTRVETHDDARAFAQALDTTFNPAMRRTSISDVLIFAAESIDANDYHGLRRVIDVSGDGPNNSGRPVLRARDTVLSRGLIINGLPLMTRDGMYTSFNLDDLDVYYRACVIGGPGAFVIPVLDWSEFAAAVRKKLVLEIAGLPNHVVPVQISAPATYDCMIGEKMWEQMRRTFDLP
ncbi:MAG: DUF1194 domain-containing protein [Pseudomonadota bacterium]